MFGAPKDYVSISLTEDTLKIAHIKGSGTEQKLQGVAKRDVKDIPKEEIPKILQEALTSLQLKKANAIFVVPASITTTKNIEIPSVDTEEINQIIDLQAGRHTPYSREEIILGYITIGVHSRNYTKVLLIIVNLEVVKNSLAIFEEAGLKTEQIFFAPEGKANFYAKVLDVKQEETPVGIIDIGKFSTDFTIEFNHTVIACRSIPLGMDHLLKEGKEVEEKLMNELAQSLDSYQSEDINKIPEAYIITSDDAKIKEFQPALQEKLKANVKVVPYLDHVKAEQPVMLKIVSEYDDESFLDIIAPIVSRDDFQVDLLPEEVKVQRAIEEQGRQIVKVAVYGITLFVLICVIVFTKIHFRGAYLRNLTNEFEKTHEEVEQLEQIATNTQIVKDYLNNRMIGVEILDELYRKIPEEIYLKNIVLREDGSLFIQGISETSSTALAFVTILENSELFKKAKMRSSSAKKERGKDVSAFEITFMLESAEEVEEELEEGVEAAEEPAAGEES